MNIKKERIVVRGAGDISTGTIHRLHRAGFRVLALETDHPSAIRREAAFSEAVYEGIKTVERVTAVHVKNLWEADAVLGTGRIPVLTDPSGSSIPLCRPFAVVDAILAKKNLGTNRGMAPLTIGLGPGFAAGEDVDYVIETMRGHDLGRIIESGCAMPDTGVPGMIAGYGAERVIHAPAEGVFRAYIRIGESVRAGEEIGAVETAECRSPVFAKIDGVLRGILPDGFRVRAGFKTADVDPRADQYRNCFTISDKARCIAGSVLEIVCGKAIG